MFFNNRNVWISPKARLGRNVKIGDNSIILDNVTLGDNCIVSNNCVIGEPMHNFYKEENYSNPVTEIGEDSIIKSFSIIYAGTKIGKNFTAAHRVIIREMCEIGDYCLIGINTEIQSGVKIGDYSRLYSNVSIAPSTIIGRYVFIFPNVVTTNDPIPPSYDVAGPVIGDFSVICANVTILPKLTLGKGCFVGAKSLVTRSFSENSFISGIPAKFIMETSQYKILGNLKPYPWMHRFSKSMPWDGTNFEDWYYNNYKE